MLTRKIREMRDGTLKERIEEDVEVSLYCLGRTDSPNQYQASKGVDTVEIQKLYNRALLLVQLAALYRNSEVNTGL